MLNLNTTALRILFGVDEIKVRSGGFIIGRHNGLYIAKGFLIVKDVSRIIENVSLEDNLRILTTYIGILNKPYPIDLRVSIVPINKDSLLRKIDNAIHTKKAMLDMDPSNENIATEINKLTRIKEKILSGEYPFKLIAIFSVTGEGSSEKEAIEIVKIRLRELKDELSTIGIRAEVLKGFEALNILNRFFRV